MSALDHLASAQFEAGAAYSDGDTLHANELGLCRKRTLDFQAKLNGFLDALNQLVQRPRLGVAAGQRRHARHIVTFLIPLEDNAKLPLSVSSHNPNMTELPI